MMNIFLIQQIIRYESSNWTGYIYVNNLFDKEYLLRDYRSSRALVGDPRTIGITLT